ncbi:hypothetical protein Q8A73_006157 [Channa argus]|nr:hypothetical protein Q8A73_006157 [Channa argus]
MKAIEPDRRKEEGTERGEVHVGFGCLPPSLPSSLYLSLRNKSHFLRLLCLSRGDALLCVRETRRQADRQEEVQKCTQCTGEHSQTVTMRETVTPSASFMLEHGVEPQNLDSGRRLLHQGCDLRHKANHQQRLSLSPARSTCAPRPAPTTAPRCCFQAQTPAQFVVVLLLQQITIQNRFGAFLSCSYMTGVRASYQPTLHTFTRITDGILVPIDTTRPTLCGGHFRWSEAVGP